MNFTRELQGVFSGALLSGFLLAICEAILTMNSGAIGELGLKARDFWWLYMILGGVLGLVVGGIIGGMVVALNLNSLRGGIYVFIVLSIPVLFLFLSGDKFDEDIKHSGIAFLAVETLTGIIVPLIQKSFFKIDL